MLLCSLRPSDDFPFRLKKKKNLSCSLWPCLCLQPHLADASFPTLVSFPICNVPGLFNPRLLHLLCPLPGWLFSSSFVVGSNVVSSGVPSLTTFSEMIPRCAETITSFCFVFQRSCPSFVILLVYLLPSHLFLSTRR